LLGEPAFEVMRHDVTFPLYVEVDEIYNLAGPASPIHYQHDPVQTTKTSVIGAINMLGLSELAGLIISLVGSRSRLEFRALPQDDPRQRCPDITRAKQILHWLPAVQLKEGLSRTIRYFDSLLSSPNEAKKIVWKVAS